jgi:hypothetical protein
MGAGSNLLLSITFKSERMKTVLAKIRLYWPLIKSLQTSLLVFTGLAGYMSARCPIFNLPTMAGLLVSLAASISGSTILNMWWDRDIDAKMPAPRTAWLPKNQPNEAFVGLLFRFELGWHLSSHCLVWSSSPVSSSTWSFTPSGSSAAPAGASFGGEFRAPCLSWQDVSWVWAAWMGLGFYLLSASCFGSQPIP